ncbi:hypothetical protein MGN70_012579 [Eutypa lata]|nr:hypothetical protein MGN70_012579 [Eutypa lata]
MKDVHSEHVEMQGSADENWTSFQAVHPQTSSLRRLFSFTQLLAFSLTFMGSWEVMAMNMGATFYNGGPQTLTWGIIAVVVGALMQALSMAELAAIQPIAGAQYHWTDFLAPERYRRLITWMQGWVTWFAWVSALAGSTSGQANILLGLVSTNFPDTYGEKPWHITVLIVAQVLIAGLINTYAFRAVPWMELCAGMLHIALWVIFIAVLLAPAPKSSAEFVVHMSEEILTIVLNGILAYGMILAMLFSISDPEAVLESPYPIIPIVMNAAGSAGGTGMIVGLLVVTFCVVAASMASVSRITWAWARDGALPAWFAKIDPRYRVPIRSVWLPVVIVSLISLFGVGNTATATVFSAFTALSSLGLYTSYIVAIVKDLATRSGMASGNFPDVWLHL